MHTFLGRTQSGPQIHHMQVFVHVPPSVLAFLTGPAQGQSWTRRCKVCGRWGSTSARPSSRAPATPPSARPSSPCRTTTCAVKESRFLCPLTNVFFLKSTPSPACLKGRSRPARVPFFFSGQGSQRVASTGGNPTPRVFRPASSLHSALDLSPPRPSTFTSDLATKRVTEFQLPECSLKGAKGQINGSMGAIPLKFVCEWLVPFTACAMSDFIVLRVCSFFFILADAHCTHVADPRDACSGPLREIRRQFQHQSTQTFWQGLSGLMCDVAKFG